MYLARKRHKGKLRYYIRESFEHKGGMHSRDLFDLGGDPTDFIRYPGGNAYYIDETVEDELAELGVQPTGDELDLIFWEFIRPDIRRKLEPFRRQELQARRSRRKIVDFPSSHHHIFDRRRVYVLRTGQADLRGLEHVPPKMFRALYQKSRDEIEQQFIGMESELRATEVKKYVFTIFNLQRHFTEAYAQRIPEFLDVSQVDELFLEKICRLNQDRGFWSGAKPGAGLHDYLIRYLIMFFDYDFAQRSFMEDYIRSFIHRRREFRPPPSRVRVTPDEASEVFSETIDSLHNMNRRELRRAYRRRAQELHPDKGGDPHKFIKLTEAFKSLLTKKGTRNE